MPNRYKTISSEIINSNPWSNFRKNIFETKSGKRGEYYFLEKFGNAVVVPILPDGRLVMVNQYRYLKDKISLEFPGGAMASGETPNECAARELLEETGYQSSDMVKIGVFEGSNGSSINPTHLFVADGLTQIGDPKNNDTEETEIVYRRIDELEEIIKRGDIWCGHALAAWAMTRDYVSKLVSSIK